MKGTPLCNRLTLRAINIYPLPFITYYPIFITYTEQLTLWYFRVRLKVMQMYCRALVTCGNVRQPARHSKLRCGELGEVEFHREGGYDSFIHPIQHRTILYRYFKSQTSHWIHPVPSRLRYHANTTLKVGHHTPPLT